MKDNIFCKYCNCNKPVQVIKQLDDENGFQYKLFCKCCGAQTQWHDTGMEALAAWEQKYVT